ncbi:KtrAB potassium uptake system, integral membrane component KtrB [uncultured Synechococcales cyanobacterium]|uniref:KtrAB potassium uptake system, integral membrane component KtrB n=1 Tax=uncultured Synechococcales cyanobacterium TaxID=1936017 RepID=A0A6J4UXR7_9CYAN|nr:KtrAB potassium uptake system, integral membrane component KtrB [uncultured Synechococcales cyanobacterium]
MTVSRTICLGFLAVIAVGTLLLMLPFSTSSGMWNDPIVALFTSTSAVCVTGHIVVDTGTYFSIWGQGLILALVQIGGLGYMSATTFLFLVLGRRFNLRDKIALQQALDRTSMQGSAQVIRSIVATSLIFEISGIFLLLLVFAPEYGLDRGLWLATFHSVSAWNNAGFSLFPDNLIGYQSSLLLNLVIPGLIIFGSIGYEVIFELYLWLRDRWLRKPAHIVFSLNFKVATTTTLILLGLGTVTIFLAELSNPKTLGTMNLGRQLMAAWFQAVTPRTAGFNTIDIGAMTTTTLFMTIGLMFVGGSPGGTAGGIKTTTLRVLTSSTNAILRGKEEVLLYERQIPISLILKAVGVLIGSVATVIIATTLISLTDPALDFIQVLFEVVSGFATVGLSTGITAGLSVPAKLALIATMYVGRVGVLLLMGALLGDPRPSAVHYPEENMFVG